MLIQNASWIRMKDAVSTIVPVIRKQFQTFRKNRSAEIETPVKTEVITGGASKAAGKGKYIFGEAI